MTEIVPATPQLAEAFYGRPAPHSFRGWAAVRDGRPMGIAGIYIADGELVVFSDFAEGLDRRTMVRGVHIIRQMLDEVRAPVVALQDPGSPSSPALLARLGFRPTGRERNGLLVLVRPVLTVRDGTIAELWAAPNWTDLMAEYEAEAAVAGMPPINARFETYQSIERAGLLHVITARHGGGDLIGFITVMAAPLPHYGMGVAVSESFFVAKTRRKSGAGLNLLGAAEAKAKALGSPGLFVSAPYGGDLFKVLPRRGYAECSRIFFKAIAR